MVSVVTGLVLDLLDPLDHTVLQLIFGEVVCASAMTVSPTSRRAATLAGLERPIDRSELLRRQREVEGPGVLPHVLGLARLGNREERGPPAQKIQRHLPRRAAARLRDLDDLIAHEAATGERRVADDRHLLPLAVRQEIALDRTVTQVVQHLVAGEPRTPQRGLG